MPSEPSRKQIERLREIGVVRIAKGDQARRAINFLFDSLGTTERIVANDISEHGGPQGDANVATTMSRHKQDAADYFDYDLNGRQEAWRYSYEERGNYAIRIQVNEPPRDLVAAFWHPHFPAQTTIIYPEISAYAERRQHIANPDQRIDVVPAPIFRAVLALMDGFRIWDVSLGARSVRATADLIHGDVIALATPKGIPSLFPTFSTITTIATDSDKTRYGERVTYRLSEDTTDTRRDIHSRHVSSVIALARHRYRFQCTQTVIAANHDRAIEAMIPFLFNEETMLLLARELRCRASFPDHFQALFSVRMFNGHQYVLEPQILKVVDLTLPPPPPSGKVAAA